MDQPSDFLDAILAKAQVEAVLQKRENDKLEREMKLARAQARSGRR